MSTAGYRRAGLFKGKKKKKTTCIEGVEEEEEKEKNTLESQNIITFPGTHSQSQKQTGLKKLFRIYANTSKGKKTFLLCMQAGPCSASKSAKV